MNKTRIIIASIMLVGAIVSCKNETVHFYARFDDVTGLTHGSKVVANGSHVGRVADIHLTKDLSVVVLVELTNAQFLPIEASEAELYNLDLMGQAAIRIEIDSTSEKVGIGDTILGIRRIEMLSPEEKISQTLTDLGRLLNKEENDSLLHEINMLRFKVDSLELLKSQLDSMKQAQ